MLMHFTKQNLMSLSFCHVLRNRIIMIVNLRCEKCRTVYDFEVGKVSEDSNWNLVFENTTICPNCGVKNKDLLTETGQSQMTAWSFDQQSTK